MLFECDAEGIEKGMAWFVGPGAVRLLKNLIAIDWADPPISVGMVSAIWVLGLLSVLGIVFPVVVLALEPETFSVLMKSLLVGSFVVGPAGVRA